jgi:hypothetical protein
MYCMFLTSHEVIEHVTIVQPSMCLLMHLCYPYSSTTAIKTTMRDVVVNVTRPGNDASGAESSTTITNVVQDFSRSASTEDWIDLFDVLIGSLIVLLHRIHTVHKVINEAIEEVNKGGGGGGGAAAADEKGAGNIEIPPEQLDRLLVR